MKTLVIGGWKNYVLGKMFGIGELEEIKLKNKIFFGEECDGDGKSNT